MCHAVTSDSLFKTMIIGNGPVSSSSSPAIGLDTLLRLLRSITTPIGDVSLNPCSSSGSAALRESFDIIVVVKVPAGTSCTAVENRVTRPMSTEHVLARIRASWR